MGCGRASCSGVGSVKAGCTLIGAVRCSVWDASPMLAWCSRTVSAALRRHPRSLGFSNGRPRSCLAEWLEPLAGADDLRTLIDRLGPAVGHRRGRRRRGCPAYPGWSRSRTRRVASTRARIGDRMRMRFGPRIVARLDSVLAGQVNLSVTRGNPVGPGRPGPVRR